MHHFMETKGSFFFRYFSREFKSKGFSPEAIILDNGPEFNNHLMAQWSIKKILVFTLWVPVSLLQMGL